MKKVLTLILVFALSLTFAGCTKDPEGPTDAENLADAKLKLSLDVTDPLSVTANIVLPATGLNGSTIVWESDNVAVITNAGVVIRPAIDADEVTVKLTATITVGEESDTKEFQLKVIPLVPVLDATIAEISSDAVAVDQDVVVTGVIISFISGKGIQISDDTGYLYVYNGSDVDDTLLLGDKVVITGTKADYFGLPQVKNVASIVYVSSGHDLPTYVETSIVDLYDEDAYDTIYWSYPIKITGLLKIEDGLAVIVATDDDNVAYDASVYSNSDATKLADLKALVGKVVTVEALTYGYHGGLKAWRVILASNATITSVDATNAQLAAYEAGQIDLGNIMEVKDNLTLATAGVIAGTTISWASDNAAVTTAGVVTRVIGSDIPVALTATVTVSGVVETKVFNVIVKDENFAPVSMTVTEALLEADDETVVVQGVVTGFDYADRPYIQDATGAAIFVRAYDLEVEMGDEIIIRGVLDTFSDTHGDLNLRQLDSSSELLEIVSTDNAIVTDATKTPTYIAENYLDHYSEVFTMTLKYLEVKDVDTYGHDHYMFEGYVDAVELDIPLGLSVDYFPWFLDFFSADDTLELTFLVSDYNYDTIRIVPVGIPVLTDAQLKVIVQSVLDVDTTLNEDVILPTEYTLYDTTIVWVSTNAAITNAGVVTKPAIGEADATGNLTATVTVGSLAAFDVVFAVTVPAELAPALPGLFISEYIEGSSNNKAIELFNSTDAAIDLSAYSLVRFSNGAELGSPSETFNLTGMLGAGEALVIAHASANATILAVSDHEHAVINHNGDDTYGLFNGTTLIDTFGVIGNTNDNYYASDHTYTRNAEILGGNTTWTIGEWTEHAKDDASFLGAHTVTPPTT